jgi:hypothetical protein
LELLGDADGHHTWLLGLAEVRLHHVDFAVVPGKAQDGDGVRLGEGIDPLAEGRAHLLEQSR